MSITKKQARDIVENPNSWEILHESDMVRYSGFHYKDLEYLKTEVRSINYVDRWKLSEHPQRIWDHVQCYKVEKIGDAVSTFHIGIPSIADEVWAAAREQQ